MSYSPNDAGIPVLTQIVQPRARTEAPAPEVAPEAGIEPERRSGDEARDARRRLEQELTGRILQQMLGRIDGLLEQRIRDELADIVQVACDGLVTQVRASLQQTLEQVIGQAVAQEMAKLRSDKTKHHS